MRTGWFEPLFIREKGVNKTWKPLIHHLKGKKQKLNVPSGS
jgi:hypothetical protein